MLSSSTSSSSSYLFVLITLTALFGCLCFPAPGSASKGSLLSDLMHPDHVFAPLQVGACYKQYGPYGGSGGTTSWNDNQGTGIATCGVNYPSRFDWRSGGGLDQITVTYGPSSTSSGPHGLSGGTAGAGCNFEVGEYIKNITFYQGSSVEGITIVGGFTTYSSLQRPCLLGNNSGTVAFVSNFTATEVVAWFYGWNGTYVDRLGFETVLLVT